jgi:sulfite exporter TauE/SafE
MEATPAWLPVMWVASGLLYLFALWQMLHRNRASYIPFVLGFGLDTIGELTAMSLETSSGVAAGPIPLIRAAGFLLTLSTAVILWRVTRAKTATTN